MLWTQPVSIDVLVRPDDPGVTYCNKGRNYGVIDTWILSRNNEYMIVDVGGFWQLGHNVFICIRIMCPSQHKK